LLAAASTGAKAAPCAAEKACAEGGHINVDTLAAVVRNQVARALRLPTP
jgi:hypothetical protein